MFKVRNSYTCNSYKNSMGKNKSVNLRWDATKLIEYVCKCIKINIRQNSIICYIRKIKKTEKLLKYNGCKMFVLV